MARVELIEFVSPIDTKSVLESREEQSVYGDKEKNLYLSGICIQGGIKNANQRIYPVEEIAKAVRTVNDQIENGYTVLGHINHPNDLQIDLELVSHMITKMWMEGPNGYGKLKIINQHPKGAIVKSLIESGVKLGVSSRGSGNVSDDGRNMVSDFEIVTVDIVAQPSGPGCYPTPVYESLMNHNGGYKTFQMAKELCIDKNPQAQKYIAESLKSYIKTLK
jgi:hypothetical protein